MLLSLQTNLIFTMTIFYGNAVKPPGYVQPSKAPDPNPPKYEYEYKISDDKGSGQGKQEQRDGIYALGRYYVQGENSKQDVQYFADDWGYHPVVEYSSLGPYSKSKTQFALGTEAVQQLKNKENNLPQLRGIFNGNERLDTHNTASSDQTKIDQGIPQSQVQIFTTQPQPQETTQGKYDENNSQQGATEEIPPTRQQELVQPVLLTGEFQQQPLQSQITDSQNTNKQEMPIAEKQPQSRVETETQNQDKTHNFIFGLQNIPQNSQPAVVESQQQSENQQTREETAVNQFSESEKNQIQQVILKHEEPTQQIIFPQQSQQNIVANQNTNVYDISEKSDLNQQLRYVQLPPQEDFKQPTQQIQLVSDSTFNNQGSTNFKLNEDQTERQSFVSLKNSDQNVIRSEQLINEKQNNTYSLPENLSEAKSRVSDTPLTGNTNKLIEHTQNLVTGKDVLNINNAITQEYRVNTESSTPISPITEHDVSQIVSQNTITNILINHEDISHSTSSTPLSPSLNEQPIIVAELEETTSIKTTDSTEEKYQSFISTTPGPLLNNFDTLAPATVIVTPRPVSAGILAPITAGVQLQNIEVQTEDIKNFDKQQYNVEVQQSLPYYLGKFEYPESALVFNSSINETNSAEFKAEEDIELGKTLLFFPGQDLPKAEGQRQPQFIYKQPLSDVNNDISVQQLPLSQIKNSFIELDQQLAQGYQHQVTVQHAAVNYVTPVPTEITKIIHKPYPVKIPYQVPYPVIKQVPVPVTVQKFVDRPIHLTKYVEKPVAVPQPYPVQKIVEKPVHVPIQVTKYIERPYPVEVRVPYPQPYPVEKVVQKIVKQPYPVEVRIPVPVEKIVEKKVPVTQYVEKPVEKIVEKPVPHYIDRPYPVEVQVPYPQPYLVQVEVPKYPLQWIQRPYGTIPQTSNLQSYNIPTIVNIPHNLPIKLPLTFYDQTGSFNKKTEPQAQQSQHQQTYIYANPYAYAPQINQYLSPKQELTLNNGYLPTPQINNYIPPKKDCQQNLDAGLRNPYYTIKPDDYIGLLPPRASTSQLNLIGKLRTARSNFDEKNIRMEYGFMPPLIPSLEIDEQGNPIDKSEK